ncbi:hypothetical protein GGS21DRAFT_162376 [Xylaria nigripes]|nr:hypothetical protein GGS21DRAFT_162376 [Xylaria nigripes]
MLSIIGIGLRASLLLIAAVVLGLSASLAKDQAVGSIPAETGISTFSGASAFFASTFGMAALWWDGLSGSILMCLDTVVSILYITSAISLTAAMKDVASCTASDQDTLYNRQTNRILSGGCIYAANGPKCPHAVGSDGADLTVGRCHLAHLDYVFQYGGCALGLAMIGMCYLLNRRGRGGPPIAGRFGA